MTTEPSSVIVVGTPGRTVVTIETTVDGGSVIVDGGITIVSPGSVRIVVTVAGGRVINCVVPEMIVVKVVGSKVTITVEGGGAGVPEMMVVIVDGSKVMSTVDGGGAGRVSTDVTVDVMIDPGSVIVVRVPEIVVVIVDGSRVTTTSVVVTETETAVEIDSADEYCSSNATGYKSKRSLGMFARFHLRCPQTSWMCIICRSSSS